MAKTVLITGASQGIGAAMAKSFAKAGYNIAINCYDSRALENGGIQVAEACREYGAQAECFIADVSRFEACGEMTKAVTGRFGAIDVLINNAGVTRDGLIARMSEESFDDVIAVNLKSVFNMIRHVGPLMMKRRSGHIINMSSVVGLNGNAAQLNYSASKAGIIGITKSAAKELGSRGVICNAIAPGFIESPMTGALPAETKQKMLSAISLRRFGTPEDIAEAALFLASTSYVTGQVLVVDGAMSI